MTTMKKGIDVELVRIPYKEYSYNEDRAMNPCFICGKDVTKIEDKMQNEMWEKICNGDPKAAKWYNDNYIQMSEEGKFYFTNEDVDEGETSQGCFAVGCSCMKKFRSIRAKLIG